MPESMEEIKKRLVPITDDVKSRLVPLEETAAPINYIPSEFEKGLAAVGKVADYPAGISRAVLAKGLSATGKAPADMYESGDIGRAFKGNSKTWNQYLERAGWKESTPYSERFPELYDPNNPYALKKGGLLDLSNKRVVGGALDILTDPLNVLTVTGSTPVKASGSLLKNIGEGTYKMAPVMRAADIAAEGKAFAPSSLALEKGLWGRGKSLEQGFKDLVIENSKKLDAIIEAEAAKGTTVNWDTISKDLNAKADAILAQKDHVIPEDLAEAVAIKNKLAQYESFKPTPATAEIQPVQVGIDQYTGKPIYNQQEVIVPGRSETPIATAQTAKQKLSRTLSDIFGGAMGERNTPKEEALKQVYMAQKEGIEGAVERAAMNRGEPGVGFDLRNINEQNSALLSGLEDTSKEAQKSYNKRPVTVIDMLALSQSPTTLAFKKGGDAAKSNAVLTGLGKAGWNIGKTVETVGGKPILKVAEPLVRLPATELNREQQNYYEELLKNR